MELAYAVMKASKSKISGVGWQAGHPGKADAAVQLQRVLGVVVVDVSVLFYLNLQLIR